MIDAPLALAFAAGLVSTVNPCGFAMLPAYLSYYLGLNEDQARPGPEVVLRALRVGAVVSAGFLVVFGLTGVAVAAGGRFLVGFIPWAALVVGAGLVLLGAAMVKGFEPVFSLPKVRGRSGSTFLFGVSYAVASLSCTLPVFLVVVAGTLTTDFVSGVVTFLVYGLGMSLVLVAVTVGLALGKRRLVGWLRGAARYVNRVTGAILVVAGAYIVWFWALNLSAPDRAGLRGPIGVVEGLSSRLTRLIGDHPLLWGTGLALVVGAALAYGLARSSKPSSDRESATTDSPAKSEAGTSIPNAS